jgi:hypothetical protein
VRYRRAGRVGWIHAEPYNGAASTAFCGRLLGALRYAAEQGTSVIALAGGRVAWSNGIHLGVIEAAADPPRPLRLVDAAPYRRRELEDVRRDIFEDRHGFQAERRRFLGLVAG